jgi:hypothetical protein
MTDSAQVVVKTFIDPAQLRKDISFSTADLSTAMVQQASLAVHYGVLLAQATRQVHSLELALEVAEAKVYRKLREEAATSGAKITEAQLEKQVAIHETVIKLKRAVAEAQQVEAVGKTAVEAFRQRRDMLIQQGLITREDMRGNLSIAEKRAAEEQAAEERRRIGQKYAASRPE